MSEFVPYAEGPLSWIPGDVQAAFPQSGPIHRYMHWATQCTDTPPLFHLGAMLPTFATRLAWTGVRLHNDHPLRLWCLLVAGAGFGKSTPLKMAQRFVVDHLEQTKDTPHEQPLVRFEGTAQGLFSVLQGTYIPELEQEIALVHTDEAAPILTQRYQDSAGKFFCQLYDGERMERQVLHLQRAVAKGESKKPVLHRPTISAAFACTLDEFETTASKNVVGNGLLSRFLSFHAMPTKLMYRQLAHESGRTAVLDAWNEWFGGLRGTLLLDPKTQLVSSVGAENMLQTRVFDPLAARFAKNPSDALFAIARRGMAHINIVAGLYALNRLSFEISATDMLQAIELFEHTLTFNRELVPRMGKGEAFQRHDALLQAAKAGGASGVAKSDFYRLLKGVSKPELDMLLDTLVDSEELVLETVRGGRGRPSQRFYLPEHQPSKTAN
jgi:hypothetical protein